MQGRYVLAGLSAALVAGCGGSGDDNGGGSPGSGTPYNWVSPVLNSTRTYSEVIVDNSNNSIDTSFSVTVTAVNPDGSYSELQSPGNPTVIVNGTNYAPEQESGQFDDSGRELSYTYTTAGGSSGTCNFDPHGAGPSYPLQVGQTWQINYNFACGTAAGVSYSQSGSVVGVEAVTVTAGSFTAIKLQSTLTWTDAQGTTRTQSILNWRDVATMRTVKQQISISYSGTLPTNGYAVSRNLELQSTS